MSLRLRHFPLLWSFPSLFNAAAWSLPLGACSARLGTARSSVARPNYGASPVDSGPADGSPSGIEKGWDKEYIYGP